MRLLDYETDTPLRLVGVLLNRQELEALAAQLADVLKTGAGYARIEDAEWGDLDITLVTDENKPFLTRRIRRLLENGQ